MYKTLKRKRLTFESKSKDLLNQCKNKIEVEKVNK